ncbi:unnamed protein product [Pedinophyceae sp. YPF-701]|nr:unnamed protein product [Pedinophyceae sp. YPF-701]
MSRRPGAARASCLCRTCLGEDEGPSKSGDSKFTAVLIPADVQQPMREIQFDHGPDSQGYRNFLEHVKQHNRHDCVGNCYLMRPEWPPVRGGSRAVALVIHDSGLIRNLPINKRASTLYAMAQGPHEIAGDCFAIRYLDDVETSEVRPLSITVDEVDCVKVMRAVKDKGPLPDWAVQRWQR